jgi:hypothetical protein
MQGQAGRREDGAEVDSCFQSSTVFGLCPDEGKNNFLPIMDVTGMSPGHRQLVTGGASPEHPHGAAAGQRRVCGGS